MESTKTATFIQTRKSAFETLLRNFEDRFMNAGEEERSDLLYSVSYALTYSILKKIYATDFPAYSPWMVMKAIRYVAKRVFQ